jgi:hypothetical protein
LRLGQAVQEVALVLGRIQAFQEFESAVAALARGQSVYLQLGVDTTTWNYKSLKSGVIPDYDRENGGHAVTVVGYRTTPFGRDFLIHNSWGAGWGERGYAWIAEATIKKHISDALLVEGVIAGGSAKPPAPPIVLAPPARPTPAVLRSCAAGTVLDVGTGACSTPCASGLAPAFGRCWLG